MITARDAMVQRRVLDAMAVANRKGLHTVFPHRQWAHVWPEDRAALAAVGATHTTRETIEGEAFAGWFALTPRAIAEQRDRIDVEVRAAVMVRQAAREVERALNLLGWGWVGVEVDEAVLEHQRAVGMTATIERWAVVAASAPYWDRRAAMLILEAGHPHRVRAFGEGVAMCQRGWLLDRINAALRKRPS